MGYSGFPATIPRRWLSIARQPRPNSCHFITVDTGRKDSPFHLQLEENNCRPLGPADSDWVLHRTVETTSADPSSSESGPKGAGGPNSGGDIPTPTQGSYCPSTWKGQPESRLLLDHFPGSQKGDQPDEASCEFETPQQVSTKGTFQDGRHACDTTRPLAKGRLDVQDQF